MSQHLKTLISKLNDQTRQAAERAASLCMARGHFEVDIEHLLLALLGLLAAAFKAVSNRLMAWAVGVMALVFMLLAALWAGTTTEALVIYRTDLRQVPMCGVYFLVGASLFCFKLTKYFTLSNVLLALVLWLCLGVQPHWFAMAAWVVLPFVVLAFGLARQPWLVRMHARDYSYGIYIYAFPVQQTKLPAVQRSTQYQRAHFAGRGLMGGAPCQSGCRPGSNATARRTNFRYADHEVTAL